MGNTGVHRAVIKPKKQKKRTLDALANCDASGRLNQPSGHIAHANPSERREDDESGPAATSRATQRCYSQTTPRKSTVYPRSILYPPAIRHQLQGVPLLPRGWQQQVEGNSVPSGRPQEAHDLLKGNEAVSISLDLKKAGEEVSRITYFVCICALRLRFASCV